MTVTQDGRWEQYVLLRGKRVGAFWKEHLREARRDVLLVIGRGFDPRMCMGLEALLAAGGQGRRDVVGLDFREGPMSPSLDHRGRVDDNWTRVTSAVGSRGEIAVRAVEFWSPERRRISSQSARDLFDSASAFTAYTDVVVDISSMPRSVYFPLIARMLYLLDQQPEPREVVNLHVLVAEDPGLDASIQEEGIDEKADFMASFGGGFDEEAIQTPKVWLPMLGENRLTQFDRIHERVKPDEICPVLPSPSRDPRRADDIVINYRERLFDQHRLDGREFIYAAEWNPFEVYRQLRRALKRYNEVFRLLGGCRVALSPLSSKLMSLGALLVAYELKEQGHGVGICHIESQGYAFAGGPPDAELVGLWLAGECDAN